MARRGLVPKSEALTASEATVVSDAVTELAMARAIPLFHSHSVDHHSV